MNALVQAMIIAVLTSGWLVQAWQFPRLIKLLPEAISAIVVLVVVALGVRDRFRDVRPAYWLAFGLMALAMLCGAIANNVESGAIVTGLRNFVRAMPLFLLPAVYRFSDRQVRSQLLLLLVLCVPQLPLAILQRRNAMHYGNPSGDEVVGTLLLSGTLSIFLIGAACVLTGFYLRKRIPLRWYVPLFLLLLAPTMINETKVSVVLLPVGLLIAFLLGAEPRAKLKGLLSATVVLTMFGALFVPVYDYFIVQRQHGVPLAQFFTEKEEVERYMGGNAPLGARKVGRADAILVPLKHNAEDPVELALGLGMGNASTSSLGRQFAGAYGYQMEPYVKSSASVLILETGLLGLLIALFVNWLVYADARVVARRGEGVVATLAVGWAGVAAIMAISTFYANLIAHEAISYLFWYFSGLIAAERVRLAR